MKKVRKNLKKKKDLAEKIADFVFGPEDKPGKKKSGDRWLIYGYPPYYWWG